MKSDATDRIADSLEAQFRDENPISFEQQLAAAKASRKPFSTAIVPGDLQAVYYYTPEEIAEHTTIKQQVTRRGPQSAALIEALVKKDVVTREEIEAERSTARAPSP